MKIFMETDRYIVREMMESDAPGMLALDSDSRVHKYLGNKTIQSEEQALSTIQKVIKQYEQNGIGRWAIEWKANGDFVGWTGLKLESAFGPIKNFYDLGYRLRPEYWGKGIATETALKSRDYAFEKMGVEVLYASAHVDNTASNHILKKVGFQWQKHFYYEDLKCNWYKLLP